MISSRALASSFGFAAALAMGSSFLIACSSASTNDSAGDGATSGGATSGAGGAATTGSGGGARTSTGSGGAGGGGMPGDLACPLGDSPKCSELTPLFQATGHAQCRSDGRGYDTSACAYVVDPKGRRTVETVYPAQRGQKDGTGRWANAKCNHAGDFVFEISVPPNPSGEWQVSFQGGGSCFSQMDCGSRSRDHIEPVQTNGDPFPADGTVSTEPAADPPDASDPGLENAIKVRAHYCSSDLWTGTNTDGVPIVWTDPVTKVKESSPHDWVFTGHFNAQAMLDVLMERYGLSDDDPKLRIHWRGDSAGGWGALNNAYLIHDRLPKATARGAAGKGGFQISAWAAFVPLAWKTDDPKYYLGGKPTAIEGFELLADHDHWRSYLTPDCVAKHPDTPIECISADALYDLIAVDWNIPTLIYSNRQDAVYMDPFNIPPLRSDGSDNPKDLAARDQWVAMLNEAMGIDPGTPNASSRIAWLFAPSDPVVADMSKTPPVLQCNVHGPRSYLTDPPGGYDVSLQAMTKRFWTSFGVKAKGEVHTFDGDIDHDYPAPGSPCK